MIWLKLESKRVRVEKEYLIWLFNPRESESQRQMREHSTEHIEHRDSIESTMAVSEGFGSERMKEKNRFENLRLGLLVKSKMVLFGPLLSLLFFFFFFLIFFKIIS